MTFAPWRVTQSDFGYSNSANYRRAKLQNLDTRMRRTRLSLSIESIPASKRLAEREEMPEVRDLLNKGTIQPFKAWHPSRMKTGLRNHPIGRKVSERPEHSAPVARVRSRDL